MWGKIMNYIFDYISEERKKEIADMNIVDTYNRTGYLDIPGDKVVKSKDEITMVIGIGKFLCHVFTTLILSKQAFIQSLTKLEWSSCCNQFIEVFTFVRRQNGSPLRLSSESVLRAANCLPATLSRWAAL